MFSVDDLLISHGYKESKSPTNSSEVPVDGDQNEDTGRQSGQASRNGLPIHPGAIPKTNKTKRYDESNLVVGGRQRNPPNENISSPGNVQGGLYDQSQLSRSSYSKKEKDTTFQRRHCQDFGAHDYSDRVGCVTRGMAAARALFEGEKREIKEGLEDMKNNKQGTIKSLGAYRRQSLKAETWKQPTVFGRCEPDIDNKERPLQYVYSGNQNIVASQVKNKLQTVSRFIASDHANYAEIPAVASSEQYKVKPELESLKQSDPATRPKYGRPLKPPSYEFYQQSRGIVESNPQDEQQKRKTVFYVTRVEEPDQDPAPLYIPPPSYKSPSQQSKNQHVPEEVPNSNKCYFKEMQVLDQSICISPESSVNQLQMDNEEAILYSKAQVRSPEKHLSSVQYIPFDDPRIRHIKVIHPGDHQMEDQAEDANNTSIFHKNYVDQDFNNLDIDQNSCALSTQRGSYDTGNRMNIEYPKARPSAQSPGATELSSEVFTKVKTFEPGTEVQDKNHLKKKTNETMFCLVSVPFQSELNIPDSDRSNNTIQSANGEDEFDSNIDLKNQSFLNMSSTDLELQVLIGNTINTHVPEKQDFQRAEFKQMHNISSKEPPKHKKLGYFGSWPGNRYKDQETQTDSIEELKIHQPFHGSRIPLRETQWKKSNTLTNGHFLKYGSSNTEWAPSGLPTDNRNGRPIPPPRKAQLNKPSKPACPRTVVNPKTGQNELGTTSTGLPRRKNEPSFAHKEERKSPCSVKEAFGQFLLKPVGRRPWDAIGELESINKELQKQEERNDSDKENNQKCEREEEKKTMKKSEEKAYRADEVSQDHGCSAQVKKVKSVTPLFKKETNKSKHESENASKIPDSRVVLSNLSNVRSEAREMDNSVKEKKENVGLNQRQDNARKITKLAIGLPPMKSNVSGRSVSANCKTLNSINYREANVENHKNKDSDKLRRAESRNTSTSETASVAPLSFKRKNQGRSEPNLRSVGLDGNEGTNIPDSSTKKIPPNESLHARASRILGIEVAVESLTTDNKTLPDKDSDNKAQSSQLSNKNILRDGMKRGIASFKGKPKSDGLKSTFIRESILGSVKDQRSGEGKLTREECFQQRPDLSKHQEDHAHPLAERKSLPSNVEKKTRSNSKVTLTRQGQVASAASRAAMDRIVQMKEVDSVSRMRRLIKKNGESVEDRDEDKKPEGKRNDSAVGHTEIPRKPSQGSCVSRNISLNKKEHLDNRTTKKSGRDLPSSGL